MKRHFLHYLFLLLIVLASSCTEPYALQTNTYENALVVEATITNEVKKQEIKITRTTQLEQSGPAFEADAIVYITDNMGNTYDFEELNEKYVSSVAFEALPNRIYQLHITTANGKSYTSTNEKLTTVNEIQSIIPSVVTRDGVRGVEINVNSYDPTNTSKYYRYEYEETYKVIAPEWDDEKTILAPPVPGEPHQGILIIPRVGETRTCFTTKNSDNILLTSTTGSSEDRVAYPIRFISNQNYIITHRYSILVRQYVQNLAAYTFYKTLKKISGNGSILSQTQPGYFNGNLKSVENPDEKVIGFFDVSTVSSKRIFFNYVDLFPGEPLPPYVTDCRIREFKNCYDQNVDPACKGAALLSVIGSGDLVYVDSDGNQTFFFMVAPPCGDCTRISSNIRPSFWID
ncbi:DUF4249 domain-containing protein [Flavobacterium sp.]|uniref:DUF4249 domain-containing protein n=1 Tax=Flavobacterium sp. TaxID=239 RepID=UPI003D6B7495